MGKLWESGTREQRRAFVQEVFSRIVVMGGFLAFDPKPQYKPLFDLDRQQRFGNVRGVVWQPGRDSNPRP